MESLLLALPALGCVLMMPAMMWLMGRGMKQGNNATAPPPSDRPVDTGQAEEIRQLRHELERLRSEVDSEKRSSSPADA